MSHFSPGLFLLSILLIGPACTPATPENRDAGPVLEEDAGALPEEDAGALPEEDAGALPEEDAGATAEEDAGALPTEGDCEAQDVAEPIEVQSAEVNGSGFIYATPSSPLGLIVFFHGGSGKKEDNLIIRVDPVLIAREGVARGYAVASLDSAAHLSPVGNDRKWNEDDTANNPDVINTLEMVTRLSDPNDLGAVPAGTPLFLIGVSNGGSMASRVSQHADIAAAAIYISNAVAFHEPDAVFPPLVLVPGQNDPGQALASNQTLLDKVELAGGVVELYENPAESVTPGLFTRVPGIDCALSQSIVAGLDDAGWLDDDNFLRFNPKTDLSWSDALPADANDLTSPIRDVLIEAFAEHAPSSDHNPEVFAFFDGQLP